VAPLVGIGGTRTALPMALVIATLGVCALLTFTFFGRAARTQAATPAAATT